MPAQAATWATNEKGELAFAFHREASSVNPAYATARSLERVEVISGCARVRQVRMNARHRSAVAAEAPTRRVATRVSDLRRASYVLAEWTGLEPATPGVTGR